MGSTDTGVQYSGHHTQHNIYEERETAAIELLVSRTAKAFRLDVIMQLVYSTKPARVQYRCYLLAAGACMPAQCAAHGQHSGDPRPSTGNAVCIRRTAFSCCSCLSQLVSSVLTQMLCSRNGWVPAARLLLCCWAPGSIVAHAWSASAHLLLLLLHGPDLEGCCCSCGCCSCRLLLRWHQSAELPVHAPRLQDECCCCIECICRIAAGAA